jgi:chromosome segregation ATPase
MSFDQILDEFHRLCESRSNVLKTIRDSENEIASISERIEELYKIPTAALKEGEHRDQLSRAKDKRKRLRQEIAEHEHAVRMYDSKIATLRMRFDWLKGKNDEA